MASSSIIVFSVEFGSKLTHQKSNISRYPQLRHGKIAAQPNYTGLTGRPCNNGEEFSRLHVGLCVYRSAQPATERGDHTK